MGCRFQAGKTRVLGRLAHEKWKAIGGGVQRWLSWAEGTKEKERERALEGEREGGVGGIGLLET